MLCFLFLLVQICWRHSALCPAHCFMKSDAVIMKQNRMLKEEQEAAAKKKAKPTDPKA